MSKIKFEFFKICSPKPLLFLVLISAAAIYFLFAGIFEYQSTVKDLEIDVEMEYRKSKLFVTYDQYSIIGYRVLFRPSPLIVFFSNSNVVQDLESKIDTTEIVKIHNDASGKSILEKHGNFRDFNGIVTVFGSLFMIVMGVLSFKNRMPVFPGDKKFFPTVLPRLLILDSFFILLLGTAYLIAVFSGLDFSANDLRMYVIFSVFILVFLDFFFFLGVFFSWLFKGKNSGLLAAVTVWALISIITPEIRYVTASPGAVPSVKELNFKKMGNLMEAEKKIREQVLPMLKNKNRDIEEIRRRQRELAEKYVNEGHEENKAMEQRFHNEMKALIRGFESISSWFPSLFQVWMAESISSKGFDAYIEFKEFVLEMREGFFIYIFKKRYEMGYKKVEPFIKKGENVYQSRAKLPGNFFPGLISMLVYLLVVLLGAFLLFKRKIRAFTAEKKEIAESKFSINPGLLNTSRTFFLYCKGESMARSYLDDLKAREEVSVIENVRFSDYDPGTSLMRWIRYECANMPGSGKEQGSKDIKIKEVLDMLVRLGVSGKELNKRGQLVPVELFKKVYLVLKLSERKSLNVFFDFFKGEMGEFELECKRILERVPGRILYISTIPLTRIEPRERDDDEEETKIVTVDLFDKAVTLR